MDIKSKNDENEIYNNDKISKRVCVLMLAALFLFLAGFFAFSNVCRIKEITYTEQREDINDNAIRYAKNLNRFYLYFKNFDSKTAYETIKILEEEILNRSISADEIEKTEGSAEADGQGEEEYRYDPITDTEVVISEEEAVYFNKAPESYYNDIKYIQDEGKIKDLTKEELIIKYKDLKEVYDNYELVRGFLRNNKGFQYRIQDGKSGEIYTNNNNIENEEYYYKFPLDGDIFNSVKFNGEFLPISFEQNNLTGYIIIPKNIEYDDKIANIQNRDYFGVYFNIKERERQDVILGYLNYIIPSLFLVAFVLIIYIGIRDKKPAYTILKRLYLKYRKFPICIKLLILILSLMFFDSYFYAIIGNMPPGAGYYNILFRFMQGTYYNFTFENIFFTAAFLILAMMFALAFILSIIFIINIIRKPSELKKEIEMKFISDVLKDTKYIFYTQNYSMAVIYLFFMIGTIISLFLFVMVIFHHWAFNTFDFIFIIFLEMTGLLCVYKIVKLILVYCKLAYGIENIALGKENSVNEKSSGFKKPFDNLEVINGDINKRIEEMTKNERLKTELITNVSHDLRTPLTSIISYIDLLKEEKYENSKAKEYLEILDSKAQRLKILVDDLFEASKLSAKQYKVDISKSDISALLKQTLGEINNKIEESKINFVIELPNNPVYLDIDGQKIWRVFDNLLNNIIKYSPENSRAYISLEETETQVKITMKNISKVPLNFDAQELFERFKRGDSSRTTEGSGLGLSIAKGIVELHGGQIFINIDGDLFKVIVVLNRPV